MEPAPVHQITSLSSKGKNNLCHFPPTGHKPIPAWLIRERAASESRELCEHPKTGEERLPGTRAERWQGALPGSTAPCLLWLTPWENRAQLGSTVRWTARLLHRPPFSPQSTTSSRQPLCQTSPLRSLPPQLHGITWRGMGPWVSLRPPHASAEQPGLT